MHRFFVSAAAAAILCGLSFSGAVAASQVAGPSRAVAPAIAGYTPRYLVTFFESNTSNPLARSATVVSVTNPNAVPCNVGVEWKYGHAGIAATATVAVAPGDTVELCSRSVPSAINTCDTNSNLTFNEGTAIISSVTGAQCAALQLSARTVYSASTTDLPISSFTDAKVVRWGLRNIGD